MATKSFKTVPKKRTPSPEQVEAFVSGGAGTDKQVDEPVKRVSIDVPESLHTRFKVACAKTRSKMAPEIIAFIEKRVLELENEPS